MEAVTRRIPHAIPPDQTGHKGVAAVTRQVTPLPWHPDAPACLQGLAKTQARGQWAGLNTASLVVAGRGRPTTTRERTSTVAAKTASLWDGFAAADPGLLRPAAGPRSVLGLTLTVAALTVLNQSSVMLLAVGFTEILPDEWRQVACPTLVVLAQSSFISAQEADEMLRQRPAAMAMSIPGTGRDLHLEQPETLHTALSDFLKGLA